MQIIHKQMLVISIANLQCIAPFLKTLTQNFRKLKSIRCEVLLVYMIIMLINMMKCIKNPFFFHLLI